MIKFLKIITNYALHILLPPLCVICKKVINIKNDNYMVCKNCYNLIQPITTLFCQRCGKPLPDGGMYCYFCKLNDTKHWFEYIRAAGVYTGVLKELVHKLKYHVKDYLCKVLAKFYFEQLKNQLPWNEIDYIVPVPLHFINKWRRGYNQSELISKELGKITKKQVKPDLLLRIRKTKTQVGLSREQRLTNLSNAFKYNKKYNLMDKNILLVDDVCTTATTINQCSEVLIRSGANKVWGATIAHGE